ncbi:HPF/RaiA family ribosome-associated protein [Mesorhizobium sp. L103C131B0]|jgi:ribosome-associated translation inhibitor RaiA|uniref:HPF/RaiA family ribosome-associated protein n=1 Tax=Mesorhizobium sp. L103C131B0 TaxID=1287089 RepID=UPI0003CFA8D0|nr:HPF/RaiA family ribosome-associated protein [Mesorhizobium sp. L103C131B0]ESZ62482.1 sigma 54 modulation protein/ribosomal protein S30EA [Mesorhizobium sp. L103C131B0]
MLVQVNSDNTITGTAELTDRLDARLQHDLARFADRITTLEVNFSDESAREGRAHGVQCSIEARIANRQAEAVSDSGQNVEQALTGAVAKLRRSLDRTVGRDKDHKGGASIRRP